MYTDVLGRTYDLRTPKRVVSLVPSLTETLFAIGAGESVVGVTSFCTFPEKEVAKLPLVGGTKNPNVDVIRKLDPDVVYVNVEENLKHHADEIAEFAPVFATEPRSPFDVARLIRLLGEIHDKPAAAERWAADIETEIEPLPRTFRFAVPIWKKPWMWCGGDTYVSALVESVGGVNVMRDELRYPAADPEVVAAKNPDVVFLPDEPFLWTAADADALRDGFAGMVIGPFPGHLFTWHGNRTLYGLRFLKQQLERL